MHFASPIEKNIGNSSLKSNLFLNIVKTLKYDHLNGKVGGLKIFEREMLKLCTYPTRDLRCGISCYLRKDLGSKELFDRQVNVCVFNAARFHSVLMKSKLANMTGPFFSGPFWISSGNRLHILPPKKVFVGFGPRLDFDGLCEFEELLAIEQGRNPRRIFTELLPRRYRNSFAIY